MLLPFQSPGSFWKGNLHGHSTASDGVLPPDEVCRRYRAAGYDFIAITDHYRAVYGFPIVDTRPYRTGDFTTLIGAEMHAPAISSGEDWHILAVGLPLDFPVLGEGETGAELARRCHAAGAFVAILHPHWYNLTLEDAQSIEVAHAVEVYNHGCMLTFDRGDGTSTLDALLTARRRIDVIAADDSHWYQPDGYGGWVMVKAEENTPEALQAALLAGAYYATQGPEIHDIRRDGDALEVQCSEAVNILALGPGARAVFEFGTGLTSARLALEPFAGDWCRVVVRDAAGRRAWSNPLWLED